MILCKYGHFSEQDTQQHCLECRRLNAKKHRKENPSEVRGLRRTYYESNKEVLKEKGRKYYRKNFRKTMLQNAQRRARKYGYPCTITEDDIIVPEFCPLLGLKLEVASKNRAAWPSLDKIQPELGYVPGNVWVISHRANFIKNDATVQELRTLLTNLEKYVSVRQELTIPFKIETPKESFLWQ